MWLKEGTHAKYLRSKQSNHDQTMIEIRKTIQVLFVGLEMMPYYRVKLHVFILFLVF